MTDDAPRYRLTPGWVAYLGSNEMRIISPAARSWTVDIDPDSVHHLAQILDGQISCQQEDDIELIVRLEELGAVVRAVTDERSDDIFEILIPPHVPNHVIAAMKERGLEPTQSNGQLSGRPAAIFADNVLNSFVLEVNKRVLAEKLRLLLIIVQGSIVSVGPLIDPYGGGPCLRCLHERAAAAMLAAYRWTGDRGAVRVGAPPASEEGLAVAMMLAHRTLLQLQVSPARTATVLRDMRRIFLEAGHAETLVCHPLPWCPDCGPDPFEERPMADYRELGDPP